VPVALADIASPRKACATSGEIFPGAAGSLVAAATDGGDDGNGSDEGAKRRLRSRANLVDAIIIARCAATTEENTAPL